MATKRPADGGSIGRRSMNRSELGRLHLFTRLRRRSCLDAQVQENCAALNEFNRSAC